RLPVERGGVVLHRDVVAVEALGVREGPPGPDGVPLEGRQDLLLDGEVLLLLQDGPVVPLGVGPVVVEVLVADAAGRPREDRSALGRLGGNVHGVTSGRPLSHITPSRPRPPPNSNGPENFVILKGENPFSRRRKPDGEGFSRQIPA